METRRLSSLFALATFMVVGEKEAFSEETTTSNSYLSELDQGQIYYGFNRVYPSNTQLRHVHRYIRWAKKDPSVILQVVSHTDAIGNSDTNMRVSKKRALIVASYLKRHGVPEDQISIEWRGEESPINSNETPEERKLNRRTTISVLSLVQQQVENIISASFPTTIKHYPSPTEIVPVTKTVSQKAVPSVTNTTYVAPSVPEAKPTTFVEKSVKTVPIKKMKSIRLVDEKTNQPIKAEFDIITKNGKLSLVADEKGEIELDLNSLDKFKADVHAYGYFFTEERIHPITTGIQIIRLSPIVKGDKMVLKDLYFESGKAVLLTQSDKELERVFDIMSKNPNLKIEIGGHINVPNKKPEELTPEQMDISTNRAKAVYDYLMLKGIPSESVSYKGYGNAEMVFPNPKTEYEKSQNRRVEIKIMDK